MARAFKARSAEYSAMCEQFRTDIGMSKGEFSLAMGFVTSGGYDTLLKSGATKQQALAAETVYHHYKPTAREPEATPSYILLKIWPDGRIDPIKISGDPQMANIMGNSFLMIPVNPSHIAADVVLKVAAE